jgi:hypothetical protein
MLDYYNISLDIPTRMQENENIPTCYNHYYFRWNYKKTVDRTIWSDIDLAIDSGIISEQERENYLHYLMMKYSGGGCSYDPNSGYELITKYDDRRELHNTKLVIINVSHPNFHDTIQNKEFDNSRDFYTDQDDFDDDYVLKSINHLDSDFIEEQLLVGYMADPSTWNSMMNNHIYNSLS